MQRIALLVATTAAVLGCKNDNKTPPAPTTETDPHSQAAPVDLADPTACQSCHPAVVAEWQQSMHARAHHSRDPIYAGVRAIRMKKEGAGVATACAACHTPGFEDEPEAEAGAVGVGCAACHGARVGAAPGQLLGPNDIAGGVTGAHGTGQASAALADGTSICMTCHAALETPAGLSMCATGAEHAALAGDASQSCASCHMPRVAGAATDGSPRTDHATHGFLGPHRAWYQDDPAFAASAIEITATFTGRALEVAVANKSGHAFPTGFPGRVALITCVGRDRDDADVWRCEPRALGKVYVDGAGKPTLAPFAVELASDTRIAVGATDAFQVETPAHVASVEVIVSMRLIPETLATKLGLADQLEGAAKPIARVTAMKKSTDEATDPVTPPRPGGDGN